MDEFTSDEVASMLAELVTGCTFEESRFTDRPGADEVWAMLTADVASMPPGAFVDVRPEIP